MIKSIKVTNYLGESITLELTRPELSGFMVLSVSGIGPGKAALNISESALQDGGRCTSARLPARNIVINLKYLWQNGIEAGRHRSYKYFPLKKPVTLVFETDTREASITGVVESNEPAIFSSTEYTSISILCPDPNFYSTEGGGVQSVVFSGIAPSFEFPFANESLDEGLIEFSSIENNAVRNILYEGDAEVGITITLRVTDAVNVINLSNTTTNELMTINGLKFSDAGFIDGDVITIRTVDRKKSAYLVRHGTKHNILKCVSRNSTWLKLRNGDNVFAYTCTNGSVDVTDSVQVKMEYPVVYEGV